MTDSETQPKKKSKGAALAWLGIAISLVAIGILVWRVDFKDVKTALSRANFVWLVPALPTFVGIFLLRAWRWAAMLKAPFWATFHANNIGYLLNVALPLRLGELARVVIVSQVGGVGVAKAFSIAMVERLLDLGAVVLMFAVFAQFVPMGPSFTRAATVGLVAVLLSMAFGVLLVVKGAAVERIAKPRLARFGEARAEGILKKFREVVDGFRSLGSVKAIVQTSLLTVLIWVGTIVFATMCMQAFLPAHTDPTRAGLVVVVANLGGAVPSAPGGLGIVQGFATSALVVPFHVPESEALAFVLVWSLGSQLLCVVLGLASMTRVGMSFSEIRARSTASLP